MRETLKSLSIFSASLLLLLVIASGCVVNIPGCGKRSLPLFKKVPEAPAIQVPATETTAPAGAIETTPPAASAVVPVISTAIPTVSAVEKEISFDQPKTPTPVIATSAPVATPTVTPTSTPWEVERIAYTTEEDSKFILHTMNTDGSGRLRHSPLGSSVYWPLWSPNGKVLAFLSDQVEGKLNLFVMKKENQGIQQLTFFDDLELPQTKTLKAPLSWSPRGDQIAFIYKSQVWVVDVLDPGTPQSLAAIDPLNTIVALEWAPRRDNKYIAYLVKEGDTDFSLWFVNPRLKDMARVAQVRQTVGSFAWTSDASQMFFTSGDADVFNCAYERFTQNPVLLNPCSEIAPLIITCPTEGSSSFLLLAKKAGDKKWRVAVLGKASSGKADTGSLLYLTEPVAEYANWSSDGSKILYVADGELWVMDATGINKKRIALSGIVDPAWSKK